MGQRYGHLRSMPENWRAKGSEKVERQEQVRLIKQIMKHIDDGTNVDAGGIRHNPSWVYTCPDLAEKEWETFYRD